MKNTVITIIILSFVMFFSCQNSENNKKTNQDDKKSTETEENSEVKNENFDDFYAKFISDMNFQLERVHFPIDGKYYEEGDAQEWTKDNWSYIKTNISDIDRNEYDVTVEKTDESVSHKIELPNSGFSMSYKFSLIDHKWYLTEMNESNF